MKQHPNDSREKGSQAMETVHHSGEEAFYEAILSLESAEECRLFFEDVCTIREVQSMAQRFRVACELDEGRSYLEVYDATGASSATICRVNKCLIYGQGYRTALKRLKKAGKIKHVADDAQK